MPPRRQLEVDCWHGSYMRRVALLLYLWSLVCICGVLYAAAASCTLLSLFRPSNNTRLMVPSCFFATVAAVAGEALLYGAPPVSVSFAFHHRLIQL